MDDIAALTALILDRLPNYCAATPLANISNFRWVYPSTPRPLSRRHEKPALSCAVSTRVDRSGCGWTSPLSRCGRSTQVGAAILLPLFDLHPKDTDLLLVGTSYSEHGLRRADP